MQYIEDLKSNSSPKIEKAAVNIIKKNIHGYCPFLLDALIRQLKIKKAWKSQSKLIKALGVTNCDKSLPFLKELFYNDEFKETIVSREIAFSIVMLESLSNQNLEFVFKSIKKGNILQIIGACSAILYKRIIPSNDQIKEIIVGVSNIEEKQGIIGPSGYIAAVSHLWPKSETHDFLKSCLESQSQTIVEIAKAALLGKDSGIKLV